MENGNNYVFATMEQIDAKLSDIEFCLFKIYEKAEPTWLCGNFSQFHKKQSIAKKFLDELDAVRFFMNQAENLKLMDNELFTEAIKNATCRILFDGEFCSLVSMQDARGSFKSLLTVAPLEMLL